MWRRCERARHSYALPLAAGERACGAIEELGNVHPSRRIAHARIAFATFEAREPIGDVLICA